VAEELSIGCIAFREFRECAEQDCCEIKRLFVLPAYRGSAIGVQLAIAALELAGRRGYQFAYLDTEPLAMAAAHRTYLKVGFVEYDRRGAGPLSVSFLRKSWCRRPPDGHDIAAEQYLGTKQDLVDAPNDGIKLKLVV
jgi:hypothetical protein